MCGIAGAFALDGSLPPFMPAAVRATAARIAHRGPDADGFLDRDVAWDLGDSLLNMWAIAWNGEQLLALLRGDFTRIGTYFDGNIFHPAPLTLAYTEHMFAPAVQALPVYAATGNPILSYNLLFLASFALSGWGMYLFVRALTGDWRAAFLAGAAFAFAPYRFHQAPHLQVMWSAWMPFVRNPLDQAVAGAAGMGCPLVAIDARSFGLTGDGPRPGRRSVEYTVDLAHRAGIEVLSWCPDPVDAARFAEAGMDAVVVDDVPGVVSALKGLDTAPGDT